jgi:glutathione S-transferase
VYVTRAFHCGSLGGTINASLLSRILLGSGRRVYDRSQAFTQDGPLWYSREPGRLKRLLRRFQNAMALANKRLISRRRTYLRSESFSVLSFAMVCSSSRCHSSNLFAAIERRLLISRPFKVE